MVNLNIQKNNDARSILNNLLLAISIEREEEQQVYLEEIRTITAREREKKGRTITGLRKKFLGQTIDGQWLYKFRKKDSSKISNTQIDTGDQVIISQYNPLDIQNPSGIVYEVGSKSITLATRVQIFFPAGKDIRLDLFVNDLTFTRMQDALTSAKSSMYSKLQKILSGQYSANSSPANVVDRSLNETQLIAINNSIGNNGFYSIQGPPGTGKTYTAARLVKQLSASNQKILVCADSNAAVDNILRKLVDLGENPLRIGNPIRVNKDLKSYTLDYKIIKHVLYGEVKSSQKKLRELKDKYRELKKPNTKYTKRLNYDELFDIIDTRKTKGTKGISPRALSEMKPFLKNYKEIEKLNKRVAEIREKIEEQLLNSHKIIAVTNVTSGADVLENTHFDWCIMDEAAQASIPSSLIPILKSQRFVLVGDHYQLPPVVISAGAKELGLDNSLMDMLAKIYPYQLKMLSVQYRMHADINNLVSEIFYNNNLIADVSVQGRVLKNHTGEITSLIHVDGKDRLQSDSKSYFNDIEANKVIIELFKFLKAGINAEQIGIISPYKAQVKLLKNILDKYIDEIQELKKLEIDTVDSFQGREKDLIILSLVRSNAENRIGFLKDYRRLNVSISRAKSRLVIIGNIKMLSKNNLYNDIFNKINDCNKKYV